MNDRVVLGFSEPFLQIDDADEREYPSKIGGRPVSLRLFLISQTTVDLA